MNIVYLAWGSLVWDPRGLPIQRYWFNDGPFASVEFARQSTHGRITLVLDEEAQPVRLLWARTTLSDPEEAVEALREREGIPASGRKSRIGIWSGGATAPKNIPSLPAWAGAHGVEVTIWTALGPRYRKNDEIEYTEGRPPISWVLDYLQTLTGPKRDLAERYFRCAPRQVDTEYRRYVEATLGWSHLDS